MYSKSRPPPIITNIQNIIPNKPIYSPIQLQKKPCTPNPYTPKPYTPKHRPITPKYLKSFPKQVPTKSDIFTYVISDAGKLIKPHSPLEPPPPLPPIKPTPKRPICKNPNKIVL